MVLVRTPGLMLSSHPCLILHSVLIPLLPLFHLFSSHYLGFSIILSNPFTQNSHKVFLSYSALLFFQALGQNSYSYSQHNLSNRNDYSIQTNIHVNDEVEGLQKTAL